VLIKLYDVVWLYTWPVWCWHCCSIIVKDSLGNANDSANYRGITLSVFLSKMFKYCLANKYENFMPSRDLQFGFKKKMRCSHAIFALHLCKMRKMGWFWVVRGHSRSWAMPPFDKAHKTSYSTLIETMCLSFYRFWDIAGYLSKVADFDPPHLHLVPPYGVTPVEFRGDLWSQSLG